MAQRLIELVLPEESQDRFRQLTDDQPTIEVWEDILADGRLQMKILVPVEQSEAVLDLLEKNFRHMQGFKLILMPVLATIPRPESNEIPVNLTGDGNEQEKPPAANRVSREELYAEVADTAKLSTIFSIMVVLSSMVAAVGIIQSNVAVIIGAMIIAPLLGPNVALSLATTLGDSKLAGAALKTLLIGIFIALIFSVLAGIVLQVHPESPELAARTRVGLSDIVLALASGSAGVLSFTTGLSTTLVGVMVAVAMLPPLVSMGLLLGAGYLGLAWNATLLFLVNVICVNLAGVITFLGQGIRPLSWWEIDKARLATRRAIILWTLLLAALAALIIVSQR